MRYYNELARCQNYAGQFLKKCPADEGGQTVRQLSGCYPETATMCNNINNLQRRTLCPDTYLSLGGRTHPPSLEGVSGLTVQKRERMKAENEKRNTVLYVADHDFVGNYFTKTLELAAIDPPKPGTIRHVSIAHDDWCDLLAGRGACNCDPDVRLMESVQ